MNLLYEYIIYKFLKNEFACPGQNPMNAIIITTVRIRTLAVS